MPAGRGVLADCADPLERLFVDDIAKCVDNHKRAVLLDLV
jgi:hypothetical protein